MTDGPRKQASNATPQARRWAARRDEARAAIAADEERALKTREERQRHKDQKAENPFAIYIGLLVAAILVATGWLILDRMRCDPFYVGNVSFSGRSNCR